MVNLKLSMCITNINDDVDDDSILNIIYNLESELDVFNFFRINKRMYHISRKYKNHISRFILTRFHTKCYLIKPNHMNWPEFYNVYRKDTKTLKELYKYMQCKYESHTLRTIEWNSLENQIEEWSSSSSSKNSLLYYTLLYEQIKRYFIHYAFYNIIKPDYFETLEKKSYKTTIPRMNFTPFFFSNEYTQL